MNLRDHAIQGVAWSAVRAWGAHAISLVVLIVVARALGPEIFGTFAIAQACIVFMGLIPTHGFAKALIQKKDMDDEDCDAAFWATIASGVVLTGISLAAAPLLATLFDRPELTLVIMALSANIMLMSLSSTQQAILERTFQFKSLAIRSLLSALAGGVVAVTLALMGAGIWAIVAQMVVGGMVSTITLWSVSTWRPRWRFSMQRCRALLHFGANTIGIGILQFCSQQADVLLIGYFLDLKTLGYYTFAFGLIRRMTDLLTATVSGVALPTFSRMQDDIPRMREAFYTATRLSSLVSIPAYVGLAVTASLLVPTVFGDQWLNAIPVIHVLAFVGILSGASFFNGPLIMACGKPDWVLRVRLINVLLRLLTLLITLQTCDIVLVAIGYVIPGYLMLPVTLSMIVRLVAVRIDTYARQYVAPIIGSALMGGAVYGLCATLQERFDDRILLLTAVLAGIVLYPVLIRLLAPTLAREGMNIAQSMIRGPRKETT